MVCGCLVLLILPFLIYKLAKMVCGCCHKKTAPKLDEDAYWGPGKAPETIEPTIKSFKINVSDDVLKDLNSRLKDMRDLPKPLEGIHQEYGMNTKLLKEIIDHWRDNYNWREREEFLNKYPQFITTVQGLKIHFLHIRPDRDSGKRVLPLLILHGWPGSFREFYNIIPLLSTAREDKDFVFELIIPSLPGYTFSEGASKPGMGPAQMAVLFKVLMKRLGHDQFFVQGGDWGAAIIKFMAVLYPDNVLGLHSNMCFSQARKTLFKTALGAFFPSCVVSKEFQGRMYPLKKRFGDMMAESGYMHIQATKPDTVGVALNDSPAGLAAYILEKFSTATNPNYRFVADGGLLEKFTYTELLDNIMLFWVTGSFTTAMRLYAESFSKANRALGLDNIPIDKKVPCASIRLRHEIIYQPDSFLKDTYQSLVHSTDHDCGGHFGAWEEPKIMADDIFAAVQKMEKFRKNQ